MLVQFRDTFLMKTNILITSIAAALLSFTVVPAIFAEDPVKTALTESDAAADGRFMDAVTRGNLAEIKAGEIAKDKTSRDDIKDFAKMMIKDHTDVNKNLKVVADKMNINLPKDVGAEKQAWLDKLYNASNSEFDRMYINAMADDHQKTVTLFEDFSRSTKNADLKTFADNTLPGLRTHLQKSLEWQKAFVARE
jgi:putative membrane protein